MRLKVLLPSLTLLLVVATAPVGAAPLSWKQLSAIAQPPAGERIAYGEAPQQFGELRLPEAARWGQGPHPVAVLVHGGCWLADYDYRYFNHLAAALTEQGVATWTLEFRRLGDAGGGWPGTLRDVAQATDHLRELANTQPLDVSRVVSVGHSAGGQLALWLGARHKLAVESELYTPQPLPLRGVVALAAITDLDSYRIGKPDSCNASVEKLLGGAPTAWPRRYAESSPIALLPLGVPQWLIQGGQDAIVPPAGLLTYAAAATAAGDSAEVAMVGELGHFDPVAPATPLGAEAIAAVRRLLGLPAR